MISNSFCLGEGVVRGLDEVSCSKERRAKAAFREGTILVPLEEQAWGWLVKASLAGPSARQRFIGQGGRGVPTACQI